MKNIFKNFCKILVAISAASSFSEAAPKWKKIISNSSGGSLQGGFMEINEDTTWTVPAGVSTIQVMVIGAGGGGGTQSVAGGGGGGSCIKDAGATVLAAADGGTGGDAQKNGKRGSKIQKSLSVTPGSQLSIFVGGGGGVVYIWW